LPRQTEQSEDSGPLPIPELNPLLNPVLGQNMGRWAEVYFTSPPEKREQAVMDLLRELESKGTATEIFSGAPSWSPKQASAPLFTSSDPNDADTGSVTARCRTCGREMSVSQNYCRMCGAKKVQQQLDTLPVRDFSANELPRGETPQYERDSHEYREPMLEENGHDVYEPRSTRNEFSLFQLGREPDDNHDNQDDEIFSYDPPSHPYRAYIGIVLAIVIVALGYMAWRSAQTTSQTAHVQSQAPPEVAAQPPATAPEPTPPAKTQQSDTPDRTGSPEEEKAAPAHSKASAKTREKAPDQVRSDASAGAKSALAEPTPEYGSQELATAQRYLSGADGQRNSAEGAKWLWKSMAKHNSTAMLLLADLYLKGDGVSKNCEQAHVLLDSAARGGMKQAGERLRHLQAFGCE